MVRALENAQDVYIWITGTLSTKGLKIEKLLISQFRGPEKPIRIYFEQLYLGIFLKFMSRALENAQVY